MLGAVSGGPLADVRGSVASAGYRTATVRKRLLLGAMSWHDAGPLHGYRDSEGVENDTLQQIPRGNRIRCAAGYKPTGTIHLRNSYRDRVRSFGSRSRRGKH